MIGFACSAVIVMVATNAIGCKPPPGAGPIQTATTTPIPGSGSGATSAQSLSDGCATAAACPKADLVFQLNDAPANTVAAQVGAPANLAFTAKSTQFPGRVFTIYLIEPSPVAASMTLQGNRTAAASMRWTPSSSDSQTGSIRLIARDMTACQKISAASAATCSDFSKKLDAFDTETPDKRITWAVQAAGTGAGNGVTSSNSGIGIGSVIGILGTVLGGPLGGVIGSLGGGLLGGGQNNTGNNGNFCSAQNCGVCNQQQCFSLQNQNPGCQWVTSYCTRR